MLTTIIDCPDFATALTKAKEILPEPETFQEACQTVTLALSLLLVSKNHKYGKENINRFGGQGIFMRLWDKIMRLEQHLFKGAELGKESSLDTWGDIAGYGLVGALQDLGWYNLPVKQ